MAKVKKPDGSAVVKDRYQVTFPAKIRKAGFTLKVGDELYFYFDGKDVVVSKEIRIED